VLWAFENCKIEKKIKNHSRCLVKRYLQQSSFNIFSRFLSKLDKKRWLGIAQFEHFPTIKKTSIKV
jgi:hypothetical protein